MSGFDANRVYNVAVHDLPATTTPDSKSETEKLLLDFLQSYRVGGEFIYRYGFAWRLEYPAKFMQGQTTGKPAFEAIST